MKDSKTIGRYFSVYFCIGVLFASYSYFLDLIFHKSEYAKEDEYIGAMGGYLLMYLVFFYISLPTAFFYNAIVNNLIRNKIVRILFGISIGVAGAALFKLPSYYIGSKRNLKVMIVMALVGLSVEIIRILVVRRRERKKSELYENSF